MRIIWSPLALERVTEIAAFIMSDNQAAAEKWVRQIFQKVGHLEAFPSAGRRVPETRRKDIRELIWGNYRIICRIEARQIAILTVRHTKQLLPTGELK